MSIQHSAIADPEIHEPKGVSTADAETVYVADGLGSGDWLPRGGVVHSAALGDVSTASSVYIPITVDGTVTFVATTLQSAIATANSTITVRNNAGASMGTITVAFSGSAAGDTDTLTPASNNTVTAGQRIQIETDGASSSAASLQVSVLVVPS